MDLTFSAVSAMTALRAQIEDRLNQTEDYRALKALDRAISDVVAVLPSAQMGSALQATPPSMILPGARPAAPSVSPQSTLMQRLSAGFPAASAARVTGKLDPSSTRASAAA